MAKGAVTTGWISGLHSDAHLFSLHSNQRFNLIARKVVSSGLAHISLVFTWISGLVYSSGTFSGIDQWNQNPDSIHYLTS